VTAALSTWREAAAVAAERLGSPSEARRLVERATGVEPGSYHAVLDEPVSARAEPFFRDLLERRAAGEPLQYVVGGWAFRRLDLFLDRRVLIPRPETEMVVQVALDELRALPAPPAPTVVDLGTGSGAIALSVAVEVPRARVWGTERSPGALAVAQANVSGVGTLVGRRVRLVEGSWFSPLPGSLRGEVQLVVSNPPYVGDDEELPPEVADWEPREALRAGPTGLEDVATIVSEAPAWLARPGLLVVELAPHQAADAVALALDAGFAAAESRRDLAGRDRMLVAWWR